MGHFAKVLNGVVVDVIVAEPEFFNSFVDTTPGEWIQTSYNTRGGVYYEPNTNTPAEDQSKALRKNYAGIGYLYDSQMDAFIPEKPYPSWILDPASCLWNPPIPAPNDGGIYRWDEQNQQWVKVE